MRRSINLLSGKKQVDSIFKKILYGSVALFSVVVLVSLGLIAYRLVLRSTYTDLENREIAVDTQFASLKAKKDKLVETKTRLTDIKKIIAARAPVTTRINALSEVVPPASTITALSGDNEEMQIIIETDDLASLNELIELKAEELAKDKKRGIKRIELRTFEINPHNLRYTISFGIEFI